MRRERSRHSRCRGFNRGLSSGYSDPHAFRSKAISPMRFLVGLTSGNLELHFAQIFNGVLMLVRSKIISLISAALISVALSFTDRAMAQGEVSGRVVYVRSVDDRHIGKDYTGAWVTVDQIHLNGAQMNILEISFELSGRYGRGAEGIGLSSERTTPSLSSDVAESESAYFGHRYWMRQDAISSLPRLVQSLDRQDQEVVYVICDLMSKVEFVSSIIPQMIQSRGDDAVYARFWQDPSRVREINRLGEACMRQIRRLVRFEAPPRLGSSSEIMPGITLVAADDASPEDQVRLAQTILTAMGLYTFSVDGIPGPSTDRALTAAMKQLNRTDAPTVENFLRVAVHRMGIVDQVAVPASTVSELIDRRDQNVSVGTQQRSSASVPASGMH